MAFGYPIAMNQTRGFLVTVAAVGLLAGACSSTSGQTASKAAGASSPAAVQSSASSPALSPASVESPAPAAGGTCTQDQLTATLGVTGHTSAVEQTVALVFTNHSATSCTVSGYPGVAGRDAAGNQAMQASRKTVASTPTITLAPGASVSATAFGDAIPGNASCATFAGGLAVTPPNTSTTVNLTDAAAQLPNCGLSVTPVVSGAAGNLSPDISH
jgi:hypothetical protein